MTAKPLTSKPELLTAYHTAGISILFGHADGTKKMRYGERAWTKHSLEEILTYYEKNPQASIRYSPLENNLVVIDIDSGVEDAEAFLSWLEGQYRKEKRNVSLPPMVITPNRGAHFIFQIESGGLQPFCSYEISPDSPLNNGCPAIKADILGKNFATLPPSGDYTFRRGFTERQEIPFLPAVLLEYLKARNTEKELRNKDIKFLDKGKAAVLRANPEFSEYAAGYYFNQILGEATEGNRNNSLFKFSCQLRDLQFPFHLAEKWTEKFANAVGLDITEARSTLQSAYNKGARPPAIPKELATEYNKGKPEKKLTQNEKNIISSTPQNLDIAEGIYDALKGEIAVIGANSGNNRGLIYKYQGGVWKEFFGFDKYLWDVMKEAQKVAGYKRSKGKHNEIRAFILDNLKADSRIEETYEHRVPPPGEMYINFPNGLYNIETGELEDHRADLYMLSQLPFDYSPTADCPAWKAFIEQLFSGDKEQIAFFQKVFGYSLSPYYLDESLIWLYGPPATGKTTLVNVLSWLAGDSCTTLDINDTHNQYQYARLIGAKIALLAEVESRLNTSKLKALLGGSQVTLRQIYAASEHGIINRAKLWADSNQIPVFQDLSGAMQRRIIPFELTNVIPQEKRSYIYKEKEYSPFYPELAGIFLWAMEGLKAFRADHCRLLLPARQEALRHTISNENDVISLFISDCLVLDGQSKIRSKEMTKAYKEYCSLLDVKPISRQQLQEQLQQRKIPFVKIKGNQYYKGAYFVDDSLEYTGKGNYAQL